MRKTQPGEWGYLIGIILVTFILGYEICGINAYGYTYQLVKEINASIK